MRYSVIFLKPNPSEVIAQQIHVCTLERMKQKYRWKLKTSKSPQRDVAFNLSFHVGQLWTAPELIRKKSDVPVYGTQPGDVYSFGVILSEIVTRALPFEKNDIQYNVAGIPYRVSQKGYV